VMNNIAVVGATGSGSSLQQVITILSIGVTIALLILQLRKAKRRTRLRPRLDQARIVVQVAGIVIMSIVMGVRSPIAALIAAVMLMFFFGLGQGRGLQISDDDGRLYATRNQSAVIVWGTGLVIMQTAGLLNRTNVVEFGQMISWGGVGMVIGLYVGRQRPLTEFRSAARWPAPAAIAAVLFVAFLWGGAESDVDAQEAGSWVLASTETNPEGDEAPPGWEVSSTTSSMNVTHTFSSDTDGAEAKFEATWEEPPRELEPGGQFEIPVTVTGRVTGNRDTQFFFGIDVIMVVNDRWNRSSVGADANCAQTTVISGEYVCSEPVTNTGVLPYGVSTAGETYSIAIGALNCNSACAVRWTYEWVEGDTPATSADPNLATPLDATDTTDVADDLDAVEERINDLFDANDIDPSEAMTAALAGVMAALAAGAITLADAMEQVNQIFEEGSRLRPGDLDEMIIDDEFDTSSIGRSGTEFDEDIADYVSNLPPPGEGASIDPLIDLMRSAAEQGEHWNRPFTLEEFERVWDAMGRAADQPGEASSLAVRDALADLMDRQVGGMPVWLSAWAMRNPVAAAETVTRLGAAFYTGGASELALIPTDVYRDITAAQRSALRSGEEFTFGDALIAGTRGQAIGWVMDGAGAAFTSSRAAAGDAAERLARGLDGASDSARTARTAGGDAVEGGFEAAGKRPMSTDELAEASARNTDADKWRGLDNETPGGKIPPDHIRQTGYTPEQAAELQRVAAENNVIIGTRTTNPDSTRFIEAGTAVPKPEYMKAKTINELDALIGGPPANVKGQVGFFEPTEPTMPRDANPQLWERYDSRVAEYSKLRGNLDQLQAEGIVTIKDGVVHKVLPDGSTKPFAGDIDAVVILDGSTGKPLTGARYAEVTQQLRDSGAQLQHGAESNIVSDIVRSRTAGLTRGTPEYARAFDKGVADAEKLGAKLNANHVADKEQVIWTHARGHYRGPTVNRLQGWQAMTRGDVPIRPLDDVTAGLRPILAPDRHD